jgi:NADH-quinone oxidoreductase subunit N
MLFPIPDIAWAPLLPPLVLLLTAALGLLFALFLEGGRTSALLALVGVGTSALVNLFLFQEARFGDPTTGFGLRYLADLPGAGFNFVILIGTALAILISYDYLERADLDHPEYYPLILLAAVGAMVMAAAADFIVLLIGLEIMSLAVYVLSAWRQGSRESEEAGMKYFLLGAFASAIFIYGIALIYGATGAFHYTGIMLSLGGEAWSPALAALGGALILCGLAFKVSFVPFHQWAPDVYTGAPTPVTAFMSVVVKAAAFASLIRVSTLLFPELASVITIGLSVLVALTLVIGNFGALAQRGVKRMLAYSAVAHAGYLGLAVLASGELGMGAVIWYLTAYTFMNIGAFAVLTLTSDRNDRGDDLKDLAGLGRQRPAVALAMTVFLLSLAGIPPLAGFTSKVLVFQAAIETGYLWLAILGILTSIVGVVYYFRVIGAMYFRAPEKALPGFHSRATSLAVAIAAMGTVLLGIFPSWWLQLVSAGRQLITSL